MRIACVHIPQFALQCATRIDPSLRHSQAAVVVVGPAALSDARALLATTTTPSRAASVAATAPVVLACSRAAWALGARVGMSATAARSLSPLINVLSADAQIERDTVRALADVMLALSPVVEVGGRIGPGSAHLALYCEVPAKTRGTTFGERLLDRLESLGIAGRVGIADDRFTAWVAAWTGAWEIASASSASSMSAASSASSASFTSTSAASAASAALAASTSGPASASNASLAPAYDRRHDETGVVSVPRGGSAAFLAPRPLSLLSISPEVQHMLELLGVRTLGEFAALPAPTVSSRAGRFEADYQALARGESGNVLRPYAPDAPICEVAVLRAAATSSLAAASASLAAASSAAAAAASSSASSSAASAVQAPATHAEPISLSTSSDDGLSAAAAVALLAERVAMRLAGRGRCAARLDITITGPSGERAVSIAPVRDSREVLSSAEQLAEAIGSALGDDSAQAWRMRVVVSGEALAGDTSAADADALDAALAVPAQRMFAIAAAHPTMMGSAVPSAAAASTSAGGARTTMLAKAAAVTATSGQSRRASEMTAAPASPEVNPAFSSAALVAAGRNTNRRASMSGLAMSSSRPHNDAGDVRGDTDRSDLADRADHGDRGDRGDRGLHASMTVADADVALSIALSTTGSTVDRVFGLTSPLSAALAGPNVHRDTHRRTRRGKQRRRADVVNVVQARLFKM